MWKGHGREEGGGEVSQWNGMSVHVFWNYIYIIGLEASFQAKQFYDYTQTLYYPFTRSMLIEEIWNTN